MTYDELELLTNRAWDEFFMVFAEAGVDAEALQKKMNWDDCFNDVDDAIHSIVKLEAEE